MSRTTEYGAYVCEWSAETWDNKIRDILGHNLDCSRFLLCFADPRIISNGGKAIRVKDNYFEEFKKWASGKGYEVVDHKPIFQSFGRYGMMISRISIEEYEKIDKIIFKNENLKELEFIS